MANEITYLSTLLNIENARRDQLQAEIDFLLKNDQEKLIWLLYRLDVSEAIVKEKLAEAKSTEAEVVTTLLLNRCTEIIETRKKYSSGKSSDWSFDV